MGQETEGSLQQWREDYDTKSKEVNLSESFFQIWIQVLVNWSISL
jgi:hypothetical protein